MKDEGCRFFIAAVGERSRAVGGRLITRSDDGYFGRLAARELRVESRESIDDGVRAEAHTTGWVKENIVPQNARNLEIFKQ